MYAKDLIFFFFVMLCMSTGYICTKLNKIPINQTSSTRTWKLFTSNLPYCLEILVILKYSRTSIIQPCYESMILVQ